MFPLAYPAGAILCYQSAIVTAAHASIQRIAADRFIDGVGEKQCWQKLPPMHVSRMAPRDKHPFSIMRLWGHAEFGCA